MFEEKITFDRFVRFLLGLAGFVLIIYAIHYLSGVLIPFAVAWVVAYMLYPIVRFFQYRCRLRSRVAAIAVTLLLLFGIIFGLLYLADNPVEGPDVVFEDIHVDLAQRGLVGNDFFNPVHHVVQCVNHSVM